MNYDEFLKLIEQCLDKSFEDEETEHDYIPYTTPKKSINTLSQLNKITDLTNAKKDKILETITNGGNIKIYDFNIIIKKYTEYNLNYTISIYEDNKNSNKMQSKVDVLSDYRFNECKWKHKFQHNYKIGTGIELETLYDIIKWLQAIKKLTIFM